MIPRVSHGLIEGLIHFEPYTFGPKPRPVGVWCRMRW